MFFRKLNKKGLTLVEVLISVTILIVMVGVVSGIIAGLYRTYSYGFEQSLAINEARRGVEVLVRKIRTARPGDDGSYSIEKSAEKEFVFYSDIDKDGETEKVRYFLGTVNSGSEIQECNNSSQGGSCNIVFSDFLLGELISAEVKVSVDGDFGNPSNEYAEIFADGVDLGDVCRGGSSGCTDCPNTWQGTRVFDVTSQSGDEFVSFVADATSNVGSNPSCPFMRAQFEFSWEEDLVELAHEFKKGVTDPVEGPGGQISYPADQEEVSLLTSYVRNAPPIFEYFDVDGNKIVDAPGNLIDIRMVKVHLVINVNPAKAPQDFELVSYVQIRNFTEE